MGHVRDPRRVAGATIACTFRTLPFPPVVPLQALCVARHPLISEHLARFFERAGAVTTAAVGISEGAAVARDFRPDIVICEYELLSALPLDQWESDPLLSRRPVIAVSLSRRPGEVNVLDINGVAGFLYMPALTVDTAHHLLDGATRGAVRGPAESPLPWPPAGSAVTLR